LLITFDIIEFISVFLLAVEAIKLNNLNVLTEQYLKPLIHRLNPKVDFVADVSELRFIGRHAFSLILLCFYLVGLLIITTFFQAFSDDFIRLLTEATLLHIVIFIISAIIIPVIVGFLPYQIIAWLLGYVVNILIWVQLKTHTGIVGLVGFLLFTVQFIGSRVIST
jgi:hypothetical protein